MRFERSGLASNDFSAVALDVEQKRNRRRLATIAGGCALGLALPIAIFQVLLYRRNLAAARDCLPVAPAFAPADRLLILSPHCDDETLGVGGTIAAARAAGAAVRVLFLTNGDGSRSTQIGEGVKHPRQVLQEQNSLAQIAYMRQQETCAALRELGVAQSDVIFLGYPDGGTKQMWESYWSPAKLYRSKYTGATRSPYTNARTPDAPYCGAQVLEDVTEAIADWHPTVVFTTHPGDTHPDHWAAYAYTRAALEILRLRPATHDWAAEVRLLTFLIHCGVWPVPHGYHPAAHLAPPAPLRNSGTVWFQTPLETSSCAAKKAALERYVSQLSFTPQYLRGFLRRDELFGTLPVGTLPLAQGALTQVVATGHRRVDEAALRLVRDPRHDSLLRDVWAAADLRDISVVAPAEADGLTLRLGLAKPASPHLTYRIYLHILTSDGAQTQMIVVRRKGEAWRATVAATEESMALQVTAQGFTVTLPCAATIPHEAYTLLVSASSYLGKNRLDQTETGTLRCAVPVVFQSVVKQASGRVRVLAN